MCGRSALSRSAAAVARAAGAGRMIGGGSRSFRPSYNIGPGRHTPIIRQIRDTEAPQDTKDTHDDEQDVKPMDVVPDLHEPAISSHKTHGSSETTDAVLRIDESCEELKGDPNVAVHVMKWGLVPSFAKPADVKGMPYKTINARSESVRSSPIYRRLLNTRRCVVPVEGFFEWHKETTRIGQQKKTPYYVRTGGGDKLMYFAGLWDKYGANVSQASRPDPVIRWTPKQDKGDSTQSQTQQATGEPLYTYTILTCEPCQKLGWLHDRMPVILDEDGMRRWLDVEHYTIDDCTDLLRPWKGELVWHAVSTKVNKVGNDGPDIVEKAEVVKEKQIAKGIGRFFTRQPKTPPKTAKLESGTCGEVKTPLPKLEPDDTEKTNDTSKTTGKRKSPQPTTVKRQPMQDSPRRKRVKRDQVKNERTVPKQEIQ